MTGTVKRLPRLDRHHGKSHFDSEVSLVIATLGWANPASGFTMAPARYAAGKIAVKPRRDGSGFKTMEALLIPEGVRHSGREGAYIMSPSQAEKFADAVFEARAQQDQARIDLSWLEAQHE